MLVSELAIDCDKAADEIISFIRVIVKSAHADGVVIGLSGGVDSSLVARLSVMALGKASVLGILMPTSFTPKDDINDAIELARLLDIKTELVPIQPMVEQFEKAVVADKVNLHTKIPIANLHSRVRMVVLFYFANLRNYLVVGTGDRSEDLIGYFTKYGDGGVDLLPISHLYKSQVRKLAQHLGIPAKMALKPSSPQLYPGHKATDEIPLDYPELDPVLRLLFEEKVPAEDVAKRANVPIGTVHEVQRLFHATAHKRSYPPMVKPW